MRGRLWSEEDTTMTTRIGIVYCERIQDASCVGCSKCYKAVNERSFAFEQIEGDLEVVFKTGCGDCPGLVLPRIDLQKVVLDSLDTGFDAIYFGTCVKKATALMNCPMNIDGIAAKIEEKFQVPVHVGTHDY
jgi:predicted metal-binding protein